MWKLLRGGIVKDVKELKSKYRKLALQLHPDKHTNETEYADNVQHEDPVNEKVKTIHLDCEIAFSLSFTQSPSLCGVTGH